jgi:nucleoside-diphosphate-sugar epimerase
VGAIQIAKEIGCDKFVSSGSLEETLTESFLQGNLPNYASTQSNYAIAKLASRDMNLICSYLDKISYIHTRVSIPLDPLFLQGGYVSDVLSKIYENKPYDPPLNNQLFDIILIRDVANAYFQIGCKGLNKADYFIGTGRPTTLKNYFSDYKNLLSGENQIEDLLHRGDRNFFNTQILKKDTGFIASDNRFQIKGLI